MIKNENLEIDFKQVQISDGQLEKLAIKLGRCFLNNDDFLDKLADTLDGIEVSELGGNSDSEESAASASGKSVDEEDQNEIDEQ